MADKSSSANKLNAKVICKLGDGTIVTKQSRKESNDSTFSSSQMSDGDLSSSGDGTSVIYDGHVPIIGFCKATSQNML